MKILLFNPDNGVTRNFMPHLWMFLLQTLTPPEHEVVLRGLLSRAYDDLRQAQGIVAEVTPRRHIAALEAAIAALASPAGEGGLPELPEPLKVVAVAGYHDGTLKDALEDYFDASQMLAICRPVAQPRSPG